MVSALTRLNVEDLKQLADALRSGRLAPPFSVFSLRRYVPERLCVEISQDLHHRSERGFGASQLADLLDLLAQDRQGRMSDRDGVDLVWTGPEAGGVASRDTAVVVRELFQNARESVLVAGYAIYRGHLIFRTLADRMEHQPDLRVRMFLDVRRPAGDPSGEAEVVRRFAASFKSSDWPGGRLPELYYDPRSLQTDPALRASLHAKCVVVDQQVAFVSSANFTEAAHLRNIEVGVVIHSEVFAKHLVEHFEGLVAVGMLLPVPFG